MATGDVSHDDSHADGYRRLEDDPRNRRQRFKERARMEYLGGAEEDWRRRHGRPMTVEDLRRALRRYPGDI